MYNVDICRYPDISDRGNWGQGRRLAGPLEGEAVVNQKSQCQKSGPKLPGINCGTLSKTDNRKAKPIEGKQSWNTRRAEADTQHNIEKHKTHRIPDTWKAKVKARGKSKADGKRKSRSKDKYGNFLTTTWSLAGDMESKKGPSPLITMTTPVTVSWDIFGIYIHTHACADRW